MGLVVAAMIIGSRMMSATEERTMVWAATGDMAAGAVPNQIELIPVALGAAARGYFPADQPPEGRLALPIAAGALLPRFAVIPEQPNPKVRFVTIAVDPTRIPFGLASGHLVDVWSTQPDEKPSLALSAVLVDHVAADTSGVRGGFNVVVEVRAEEVSALLSAMRGGEIDLVSVPLT